MTGHQLTEDVLLARTRVVDHWKRLFAILVGFAITVACQRAYTCWAEGDWVGLAQFLVLLITIPPIFHGVERSLDVRHLGRSTFRPGPEQLVADTTTLILTGLFFLAMAFSIPHWQSGEAAPDVEALRARFFVLFVVFLGYDGAALAFAQRRFAPEDTNKGVHEGLALLNVGTALFAALLLPFYAETSWLLVVVAAIRTALDYWLSWRFLYPTSAVEP